MGIRIYYLYVFMHCLLELPLVVLMNFPIWNDKSIELHRFQHPQSDYQSFKKHIFHPKGFLFCFFFRAKWYISVFRNKDQKCCTGFKKAVIRYCAPGGRWFGRVNACGLHRKRQPPPSEAFYLASGLIGDRMINHRQMSAIPFNPKVLISHLCEA